MLKKESKIKLLKTSTFVMIPVLLVLLVSKIHTQPGSRLDAWRDFSCSNKQTRLLQWVRKRAEAILKENDATIKQNTAVPPGHGNLGIFITLTKNGKVRGCCGAFHHSTDDFGAILNQYLNCAMSEDNRHKPVEAHELEEVTIVLTVTSQPFPVADYRTIDLSRYGLYFRCNGQEQILFVPEELKTTSYMNNYIRGKTCQASAFEAVTLIEQ